MERVFSGVQPTGNLHIGNYLGAIRHWVQLQKKFNCIFCIVDLHAITVLQNPCTLKNNIRDLATFLIAAGIDPEKHILFPQSQVTAHTELAWILNCITPIGWLNRMVQFKEKSKDNDEKASLGLYAYPNLMASDILLYKATHIPVGEDQKQHIELTRNIAMRFNKIYQIKNFFPNPKPLILGNATRIMSLRNGLKKMSKSDKSDLGRINMDDSADTIAYKIRRAKTDFNYLPSSILELEEKPELTNLVTIYAAFSDDSLEKVLLEYGGRSLTHFKKHLTDRIIAKCTPITEQMNRLKLYPCYIEKILEKGSENANMISQGILENVKTIIGLPIYKK